MVVGNELIIRFIPKVKIHECQDKSNILCFNQLVLKSRSDDIPLAWHVSAKDDSKYGVESRRDDTIIIKTVPSLQDSKIFIYNSSWHLRAKLKVYRPFGAKSLAIYLLQKTLGYTMQAFSRLKSQLELLKTPSGKRVFFSRPYKYLVLILLLAFTLSIPSPVLAQNKRSKKAKPKIEKTVEKSTEQKPEQATPSQPLAITTDSVKQFETGTAEERFEALNRLAEANHPELVGFITRALKDIDWLIRTRALQLIVELPEEKRTNLLLEIPKTTKDSYFFVRGSAALAIADIASQKHVSEKGFIKECTSLLYEMRLDENAFVREQAIKAISASDNPRALEFIAPMLTDENINVRWTSAMSLVKLNDHKAVNYLITARELKPDTKEIFSIALYHFGERESLSSLLTSLEQQVNLSIKRQLIEILCQADDLGSADTLVKLLQTTRAETPRDEKVLFQIIPALSRLRTDKTIEALKTLLTDEDNQVQLAAIQALSDTKSLKIPSMLIERLLLARDREIGEALIKAIASFEQVETIDALFRVRKDSQGQTRPIIDLALNKMGVTIDNLSLAIRNGKSPSWQTPRAAARWLAALGIPSSLEPLVAALGHRDPQVRTEAAQALGGFGDRAAIEPLIALLEDSTPSVKVAAIESLKTLGINIDTISTRLQSSDWRTRADAANLSGRMGIKEVVPLLITALHDPEVATQLESIKALAKLKDHRATESLISVLDDENAPIRATAAVALGNLGDEKAAEPLVKTLTSYDVSLGALAADSLIKLSSDKAIPALTKTLASRNWRARAQAARVLGHLRPESAIGALIPLLGDSAAPARYYSCQALSKMGSAAVNPMIEALRKDTRGANRYGVARALATIGKDSVDSLCHLLTDTDESLRVLAVIVLAEIGDQRAIEPLVTALDDERFIVRASVASALGRIGQAALPQVLDSLQSKVSPKRRAAAALALKALGLREAAPALVAALSDKEDTVRANAAEALSVLGDNSVVGILKQIVKSDRADTVRAAAQRAINNIETPSR